MYDDELHMMAAAYANKRKDVFNEAVERGMDPPPRYIQEMYQWLWVAHYEGFKNGYNAKEKANEATDTTEEAQGR